MVKGNAYATLKCSLDKLQKEGLKEKVLDFLSVRCDFNVYDVKNLTAEEATILTTKIRDRKKMLKQMVKRRQMKDPKKKKIIVIYVDDSEEEILPPKKTKMYGT